MKDRIVGLRKSRNLTQDDFAEKMGISKNYVSLIENGKKIPSDRLISDICREFNVNKDWLTDGKGEPYTEPEDEVAEAVSDLLEESNPFYDLIINILKVYKKLDDKSQTALKEMSQNLLDTSRKRED